jgi:hypothetical protein
MDHHYYASSCYGWGTGDTKEAAIKESAKQLGVSTLSRHKPDGVMTVVCRVALPKAAHYSISHYMPNLITKEDGVNDTRKGETVPISEVEYVRVVSTTGKFKPAPKDPE